MTTYLHEPTVLRDTWYRVDTASGSDTATTVYDHQALADAVPTAIGASGSTVRGNRQGSKAHFWSATATLYLKQLDYQGTPTGTVITSTGAAQTAAPDLPPVAGLVANVNTVAASGATQTIPEVGSSQLSRITLTASCTLTFPTAVAGERFTLVLVQGGSGSYTITWPGTVKWAAATAPTLSTAVGKVDALEFICADGTNWLGRSLALDLR